MKGFRKKEEGDALDIYFNVDFTTSFWSNP